MVSQTLSLGTEGRRFNTQTDTGLGNDGYGTITGGVALPDSDGSGMPDDWKAAEGLSLTNPAISGSTSSTGYTYLENYLAWKALPNAWVAKNTDRATDLRNHRPQPVHQRVRRWLDLHNIWHGQWHRHPHDRDAILDRRLSS